MRLLSRWTSPAAFAPLAILSLIALYINVASGALVRVTSSGLGCPDWPACSAEAALPALSGHQIAEFGNRVLAAAVVVATVFLAISAWRGRELPRTQRRLGLAIGIGTFAQGPLGGVTVLTNLHPVAVMSHFLLAVVIVACATVLVVDLRGWSAAWERPSWAGPAGWVLAVWGLALVISGAVVTASGTHPGDRSDIPRMTNLLDAAYVHVRVAVSFVAVLAIGLWLLARIAHPPRRVARVAAVVVALTAVQVLIGEIQWRSELQWWLVLLHVLTATALWIALVAFARLLAPAPATATRREPAAAQEPSAAAAD